MLYDESQSVLLSGDSYYNGALFLQMDDPYFGKSSLEGYYLSLEKVLSKCVNVEYVFCSHNQIMVNFYEFFELRDALAEIRSGKAVGTEVSGLTYNYYGDPQPLLKYQYEHFSVIVDAVSMEPKHRTRLALYDGGYTCFIVKDDEIFNSYHRGVKPLLDWLDAATDLKGAIAADKVIGKAAAYLYVLLGVAYVYAGVISKPALDVFDKYGITCQFGQLVDAIENRTKTGFCPMERAVWDVDEPEAVPGVLKEALKQLAGK
jgi:hypothetical protein